MYISHFPVPTFTRVHKYGFQTPRQSYTFPQLNSQNVSSDISYFPSSIHLDIHTHPITAKAPQKKIVPETYPDVSSLPSAVRLL